ncbi:MAG: tetratricopeptide repeat protein [Cyanobacteria bacterium J06626_18]
MLNFRQKPRSNPSDTPLGGRYQIIQRLGEGGFGQTFLAQDKHLPGHPICVIKQLNPQVDDATSLQTARRLFDTEARVLYQLGDHDQIPRLMAHFEDGQEFYLAQEYVESDSLGQVLTQGEPWSQGRVIALLEDILQVLTFVHDRDVIHRDIKPANLLCRRRDGRIVLIDFGAVKQVNSQFFNPQTGRTNLTISIGTQGYMPNEQLAGTPHFSSDVYAVGIIGIQALTSLHPKHLGQDPRTSELDWQSAIAEVDPALAAVLDRMVRYDFRARYPTATAALAALQALPQALRDTIPEQWYIPPAVSSSAGQTAAKSEAHKATMTWSLAQSASPSAASGSGQETLAAMGHRATHQFDSAQKPKGSTLAVASVLQSLPQRRWWLLGALTCVGTVLLITRTSLFAPSADSVAAGGDATASADTSADSPGNGSATASAGDSTTDPSETDDSATASSTSSDSAAEPSKDASDTGANAETPSAPTPATGNPGSAAPSTPTSTPETAQPVSQTTNPPAAPATTDLLNKANALRENQQYLQALEAYDQAIAQQPNAAAHWGRCYSLNQMQQLDAAIAACDQAIALDASDPRPLSSKGFALQQQQRHAEALALFDRALDLQPDNVEAWNNRGISLLQVERIEEALNAFDKAIDLQPDLAEAWNNRGAALWSLRRFDEAITSTEQAIALDPNYTDAQNLRQKMREKLGR